MADENEENRSFDTFELCTAILLGLAAIGAAISGQQAGQWGGKQLDAFGEANTMATKAATQYNEDMVLLNADYSAVANAKMHILEARDASDAASRDRHFEVASYLYSTQLTSIAYQAMELPMEYYVEDEEADASAPSASTPAAASQSAPGEGEEAADAEESAEPEAEAPAAAPTLEKDIPDAALLASLTVELDEDYSDSMLAKGEQMFAEADKRFAEGRTANTNGDQFDLVGVYYTIALFFAGLGLVFKTRMRWKFFYAGTIIFVVTTIYMATLNWTS